MKKTIAAILAATLAVSSIFAGISGYVGVSTGYEVNLLNFDIRNDARPYSVDMNMQGVPFIIEGETYFNPYVGIAYGATIITIPTIAEKDEAPLDVFAPDSPGFFTSPSLGLALRYDFTPMIALTFDTGLAYLAWMIPEEGATEASAADFLHMLDYNADLALSIHPMVNMAVRIGMKVDTPIYTGYQCSSEGGIGVDGGSATALGVKLTPYVGLGYCYGR